MQKFKNRQNNLRICLKEIHQPTLYATTYINFSRLGKIIKHMQEAKSLSNEEEATQSYLLGGTAIGILMQILILIAK